MLKNLAKTTPLVLVAVALTAAPAFAQTEPDRVTVGGRPATKGYSKGLAMSVVAPSQYARGCCYTSFSGEWLGPRYRPSKNQDVERFAAILWEISFQRSSRSLAAVAAAGGETSFSQAAQGTFAVPHLVGGRKVGTLPGSYVIDAEAAPGARQDLTLAVDLGRKVKAVVDLYANDPVADDLGESGLIFVNGQPASQWNRGALLAALKLAMVEGSLPPKKIKPKVKGKKVSGSVVDSFGHPDGEIPVRLQQRKGGGWKTVADKITSPSGKFSLAARGKGAHRVVATLGGTTVRKTVKVR